MNTITRRITVVGIALVVVAAIGGTASGAGAGGAVTCRTWDPHVVAVGDDDHLLHPAGPDSTDDPWNPEVPGEGSGQDPWHPASPGGAGGDDPWNPAAPAGDRQDAWHPDNEGSNTC